LVWFGFNSGTKPLNILKDTTFMPPLTVGFDDFLPYAAFTTFAAWHGIHAITSVGSSFVGYAVHITLMKHHKI
jgi:hypothetical protein